MAGYDSLDLLEPIHRQLGPDKKIKCVSMVPLLIILYHEQMLFNMSSRRKRGMASNPLFIIPDFFFIFQTNLAMATLGLKEMRKFLWEGREKVLPC